MRVLRLLLVLLLVAAPAAAQQTVQRFTYVQFVPTTVPSNATEGMVYQNTSTHQFLIYNGTAWFPAGSGTVAGPASSTNHGLAAFSGTAGATLEDTGVTATSGVINDTVTGLVATSTDGLVLANSTAATSGVLVQMPPRLRFRGNAWSGSASETVDTWWELLPQSGTVRGQIRLGFSRNGGATFYPVTIDSNPTSNTSIFTLGGVGSFRGGDGSAASPTFGFVNSGGGSSIGFWTPAANDLDLVAGSANQILWGVSLWRNSSALSMGWSSATDPNSAVADTAMIRQGAAKIRFYNKPEATPDAGFTLDFSTDSLAKFRNRADSADADIQAGSIRTTAVTFANRPGTPVEGMIVAFTDSTTIVWGATITGTGANHVLGYYNGTNWTVIGK